MKHPVPTKNWQFNEGQIIHWIAMYATSMFIAINLVTRDIIF